MTAAQTKSQRTALPTPKPGTRERILEAGIQLFAQLGYEGTGIRDIEAAAGVKRGVVTYHCGNKESVWKQVFEYAFLPYLEQLRSQADLLRALEPEKRVRYLIENFVRTSAARPYMNQLMIQENFTESWRSDWIVENFLQPARELNKQIAAGDPILNRLENDPHFRYVILGACATVFSHRCEVRALFDQDVSSQEFVDRHVETVMQLVDCLLVPEGSRAT